MIASNNILVFFADKISENGNKYILRKKLIIITYKIAREKKTSIELMNALVDC